MKSQTRRDRRGINIEDQICTVREKTFNYLDEIGIPDDWTGQQIEDRFKADK